MSNSVGSPAVIRLLRMSAAVLVTVMVGSCSEPSSVLNGPLLHSTDSPDLAWVYVCKHGADGEYQFTASLTGDGQLLQGSSFTLAAGQCKFAWVADTFEDTAVVTVAEVGLPEGIRLDSIVTFQWTPDEWATITDAMGATLNVDGHRGAKIHFYNGTDESSGGQGCTPGYWKQEQHFDSWVGNGPGDLFVDVFGRDAFPGQSLLGVLRNGGGGLYALGRHSVAALLDASSSDVDYGYTTADVIQMFQDAYDSGDYETQKNLFDEWNNRGCPLN